MTRGMRKIMDTEFQKALVACRDQLLCADGDDPKGLGTCFFRMGVVLSHLGEIQQSIRCFNDAFLIRDQNFSEEQDIEWKYFHDTQMAIYVLGKERHWISSLAEGDMVHDLIKSRWTELQSEIDRSEIPFSGADSRLWFRTVKVEFPWDMEPFFSDSAEDYSQFDHFAEEFIEECVKITH